MRGAAKALLARRVEPFESLEGEAASRERLRAALERAGRLRAVAFHGEWKSVDGKAIYEAAFAPAPRAALVLQGLSGALALLLVASAWTLVAGAGTRALRFLLALFTLLGMVAMPLVVQALASQREAEESRVTRAIRAALQAKDERFPPEQRWADEE